MQKNTFCFKKQKSPAEIARDVVIALICFAFTFLSFKIVSPDVKTNADGKTWYYTPEGSATQYSLYFYVNSPSNAYMYSSDNGFREAYQQFYGNTSCKEGFSVTVSSLDESNDFVNSLDRTKTISSVQGPTAKADLVDNTWGFFVSDSSSINTNNSVYSPLPKRSESPYVAIDTTLDYSTNSSIYRYLHYGVKVDGTMPAGNYYRELLYTVYGKSNCSSYSASFYIDGKSSGSIQLPYGSTVNLRTLNNSTLRNLFQNEGKRIVSIKDRNSGATYDIDTPADLNPGNNSSITIDITTELIQDTFSGITKMQEMTQAICDAETTPLATATDITFKHTDDNTYVPRAILEDTRDHNKYLVSKLADGNCWMSQNLALDLSMDTTLTSDTTDLRTKSSWTPQTDTLTATGTTWTATDNKDHSYHSTQRFVGGYSLYAAANTAPEYNWELAGNYYNWYAATAGSGTSSISVSGLNVSDSICPKGWHLPTNVNATNNKGGSYADLLEAYNTGTTAANKLYAYPLNMLMSGMYGYSSGKLDYATGDQGMYWTSANGNSSSYATSMSYSTGWSGTQILPTRTNIQKGMAAPIRCTTGGTYTMNFDPNDFTNYVAQGSMELNFGHSLTRSEIFDKIGTRTGINLDYSTFDINNGDSTVNFPSTSGRVLLYNTTNPERVSNIRMNWYYSPLSDLTYLQDFTPGNCAVTTTPFKTATSYTTSHSSNRSLIPQKALTDRRDGKKYTVRKLANGECWMVSNLNYVMLTGANVYGYNAQYVAQAETATKIANTDLEDDNYYSRADNAFSQTKFFATQSQPYTVGQTIDNNSKWGQTGSDGAHSYYNYYYRLSSGTGDNPGYDGNGTGTAEDIYVARSDNVGAGGYYTFSEGIKASSSSTVSATWLAIGTFYNWTAAVAGKMDVTTGDAESSLCPKGWELPSATGAGSYSGVFDYYRNTTSSTSADDFNWAMEVMNLYPGGYYDWANTGYANRASTGYFWTKTSVAAGTAKAAHVSVSGTQIDTNLTVDKGVGANVRCVLRQASN